MSVARFSVVLSWFLYSSVSCGDMKYVVVSLVSFFFTVCNYCIFYAFCILFIFFALASQKAFIPMACFNVVHACVVKSTVSHCFVQSLHSVFCFCFPPPVAMSLTMITTEKTSMTGKRKGSTSLSIHFPFRGSRVRIWTHGLLALLTSAIARRLIQLTFHRPEAEDVWRLNIS